VNAVSAGNANNAANETPQTPGTPRTEEQRFAAVAQIWARRIVESHDKS
jgi:hypothetical protein